MAWQRLFQLECGIRHYDWGERPSDGSSPFIARLLGVPDSGQPFAELWMGDHPSLPAAVTCGEKKVSLHRLVAEHAREILGAAAAARGCRSLPFLLKVLSCERPLSIQAHPDRQRAAALHRLDPKHYPDANHKPEIAIALTPFRALASFRTARAIQCDLSRHEPLHRFFGGGVPTGTWLKQAYARPFHTPRRRLETVIRDTLTALERKDDVSAHDLLFRDCARLFPGDPGVLTLHFLNLITLDPGQALFMAPNEPHAYLTGTLIECMAASDNVIRAGLTGKYVDAETLLAMLTYSEGPPRMIHAEKATPDVARYTPPVPEFGIEIRDLRKPIMIASEDMVSVMLVLDGKVRFTVGDWTTVGRRGTVWLWPALAAQVHLEPVGRPAKLVRAFPRGVWDPVR